MYIYLSTFNSVLNIFTENIDYTYNTTFDYVKRENGYEFAAINGHDMKVNTIGRVYFNLEGMLGDGKLGKSKIFLFHTSTPYS